MTDNIIAIPPCRAAKPEPKRRLDDMRNVPFPQQPPAVTRPGETWNLNGYHMTQVIIVRDGPNSAGISFHDGQHQVAIAEFKTVRDAAIAVQCKAIVDRVVAARDRHITAEGFARAVNAILQDFDR